MPNPNREGLSNIKLNGKDVCPVPSEEIREEYDPNYTYTFPNGLSAPHNSVEMALARVNNILEQIKDEENYKAFMGIGQYAE